MRIRRTPLRFFTIFSPHHHMRSVNQHFIHIQSDLNSNSELTCFQKNEREFFASLQNEDDSKLFLHYDGDWVNENTFPTLIESSYKTLANIIQYRKSTSTYLHETVCSRLFSV